MKLPESHEELDRLAADPTGSICWVCDEFELFDGEPYTVCFECGHVFQDAQALIDEYNLFPVEMGFETFDGPAHEIPFCPVCLHDF